MNSMIENLVIDMRALGIKSLALELSDDSGAPAIATSEDRATLAPDDLPPPEPPVEPEFRGDPNQCAHVGCGEPSGGILGGKQRQFCRKHAFEKMGIR
jgi:hypothetical protein